MGKGRGWYGERERHRLAALKGQDAKDSKLLLRTLTKGLERSQKYGKAIDDLKWILKDWSPDAYKPVEDEIQRAMKELEAENFREAIEAIETAIEYSSDSIQVEFLDETKVDLLKEAAGI